MEINNAVQLKEAIALLEKNVDFKKQILLEQFHDTYEGLKPVNLAKNAVKKFAAKPGFINKLVAIAVGKGAGAAGSKLLPGKNTNIFKKFFKSAIQLTLSGAITKKI